MSLHVRRLLADWELWHAMTMVSLVVWVLARTNRYALIDGVYALIWNRHGVIPPVSRVERDQIRPVVELFVGMWLLVAIASFVCGFFVFHVGAETRRRSEGNRAEPKTVSASVNAGSREAPIMTRENLATASDTLESAADTTTDDDAAERLESLADQLDTLATRDRDPDHGRLARIENALNDLEESADDVANEINSAHESVVAFRETVEGV